MDKKEFKKFKEWCYTLDYEMSDKIFHSDLTYLEYYKRFIK